MRTRFVLLLIATMVLLLAACQGHEALPTSPESNVAMTQASTLTKATTKDRGTSPAHEIEGTITNVASDGSAITVHDSHGHDDVIAIAPATVIRKGDQAVKASDLAVNDHVHVKATTVNNVLTATLIIVQQGESEVAVGTVKSVGTNSLVVTTRNGDVTVNTDPNTVIVRDGQKATLADIQSGDQVAVAGTKVDATTMLARMITARSANAPVPMAVEGTVKSVGATSLVVTTEKGDITVNTDANTVVVRDGQKAALTDLQNGDRVTAVGTKIDATTMLAKAIAARSANAPSVMFADGSVKSVGANSIVITTHNGDITVNTDANTIVTVNGQKAALTDIKVGDEAAAAGTKVDATTMLAKAIAVHSEDDTNEPSLMFASGTVKSVGADSLVVTTKNGDITVNTDANTVIYKAGQKIALADVKSGDQVTAAGTKVDATTMLAKVIQVGSTSGHHD